MLKLAVAIALFATAFAVPINTLAPPPPAPPSGGCGLDLWATCGVSVIACIPSCDTIVDCVKCMGTAFPTCCPCIVALAPKLNLTCNALPLDQESVVTEEFRSFMATYGRSYDSVEELLHRARVFATNLAHINRINSNKANTWTAAVNKLADQTTEEIARLKGYHRGMARSLHSFRDLPRAQVDVSALPDSVDWRTHSPPVVSAVKDQGGCGSCWAFSTAETMESAVAIASGKLLTFSEQQLVDCAPNPQHCGGTGGCSGSVQEVAMNYSKMAGITTEASYPYTARTGSCQPDKIKSVASIDGYVKLPTNDYNALMNAVATVGPIAISVAADWSFYSHGIFNSDCGWTVDHAVQLVGYGAENGQGYWIVRNSWGSGWGESGYIRLAREADASKVECGTDTDPQSGDGCDGGPATIQVCGKCAVLSDSSYPTGAKLKQ